VRGGQVSGEYAEQGSLLDAEGWFATRDPRLDRRRGLPLHQGRNDDTIIRGERTCRPPKSSRFSSTIRQSLKSPLSECQTTFGDSGLLPRSFPRSIVDLDLDELRGWAKERLRSSRTPDEFAIEASLPYSETGKLLRRQVVEWWKARLGLA